MMIRQSRVPHRFSVVHFESVLYTKKRFSRNIFFQSVHMVQGHTENYSRSSFSVPFAISNILLNQSLYPESSKWDVSTKKITGLILRLAQTCFLEEHTPNFVSLIFFYSLYHVHCDHFDLTPVNFKKQVFVKYVQKQLVKNFWFSDNFDHKRYSQRCAIRITCFVKFCFAARRRSGSVLHLHVIWEDRVFSLPRC